MIILIYLLQILNAGQVKITPELININQLTTIEYTPTNSYFEQLSTAIPYLVVYYFDNNHNNPYAVEYPGKFENGKYIYTFRPDSIYNYAMFKFTDGLNDDNNKFQFWDFIINKYDKAQYGSNLKKATSYLGNLPPNIDRLPDFKLAENFIKKELELFPDNFVAEVALIQVRFDQGLLKDDAYNNELKLIINKKIDLNDENNVRALSRALKTLGINDKAKDLEVNFAKDHPNSELYEELLITKLSEAKDLLAFVEICNFYLENYGDSPKKEQIMLGLVNAFLQSGNYTKLKNELNKINFIYPSVYSKIASELADFTSTNDGLSGIKLKNEILNNYNKSITLIDSLLKVKSSISKPRYFSNAEQYFYNYFISGTFRQNLGEFYLENMELDSADYYLNSALKILNEKSEISLYTSLIQLYKLNANTKKIIEISEKAIFNSKYNDTIINICKSVLDSTAIDSLFQIAKKERINNLAYNEIEYKTFTGLFKTTKELYKDIESDTNNYKIITFFATWCVPCQEMISALEEIEVSIPDDASLYAINAWENPKNRDQLIAGFLDEYKPKYNILIDETSIIPQKYGVTGLPITYILNKQSKIRFRIEGYTNKPDFVRNCLDRIEYLKIKDR